MARLVTEPADRTHHRNLNEHTDNGGQGRPIFRAEKGEQNLAVGGLSVLDRKNRAYPVACKTLTAARESTSRNPTARRSLA
jgi:hypothetical protein